MQEQTIEGDLPEEGTNDSRGGIVEDDEEI